jgi:HEAT repeat protein
MAHYDEGELTLYHYGEARRPDRIEQHLQSCEVCAGVYRRIADTLALVGEVEVPERDERYGLSVWQRIRHDLPPQEASWLVSWSAWYRPALIGVVGLLIVTAFVAGQSWRETGPTPETMAQAQNLADLRQELREMRQMLTLSLMQQQSATERLRGVSGSTQIEQPGNEIIRALLDTLLHDSNVNVRLASVDALRRFSTQDLVRREIVRALADSSFPLVQIAVIDFMVETKDTDAIDALRRLSQDATANEAVRGRAVWGVEQLSV